MGFLVFTVGMVGYVLFFQTVTAAELPAEVSHPIMYEEPDPPQNDSIQHHGELSSRKPARIAIIIDDMGYHQEVGEKMLGLPFNLAFSFLPHAPYTLEQDEQAYQKGRAVLLHLPLQPVEEKWHLGPGALYLHGDIDQQKEIIRQNIDAVPHAIGVNNHMGSLYTTSRPAMSSLMDVLKENGLFFIDSFTSARSVGMEVAALHGVKTGRRHVFLDNARTEREICSQLETLVDLAGKQGWAIGIGHPYPETLKAFMTCAHAVISGVELVDIQNLLQ